MRELQPDAAVDAHLQEQLCSLFLEERQQRLSLESLVKHMWLVASLGSRQQLV